MGWCRPQLPQDAVHVTEEDAAEDRAIANGDVSFEEGWGRRKMDLDVHGVCWCDGVMV